MAHKSQVLRQELAHKHNLETFVTIKSQELAWWKKKNLYFSLNGNQYIIRKEYSI